MKSEILFASYHPKTLEPKDSIGAKWVRLLDRLDLPSVVSGKRTAVKMHLGGGHGFTTIHPFFVRKLVEKVKTAGAKEVFVTDSPGAVRSAAERGYTAETLGCPLVSVSGTADRYYYRQKVTPAFKTLETVDLAGEIVDADALIDFSHAKGHGACGFGGASKNLSMGCVTQTTRRTLHALEGGLKWDAERCTHCEICVENCPNNAMQFNAKKELDVFYHNCKFCQHCVLICPKKAIKMEGGAYKDFQEGMARVTKAVLDSFAPGRALFINMLMDISIYCDCWGMTLPAVVPDIGIVAGRDIVAVETASLDLIKPDMLIPSALPAGLKLGKKGHLFERIHSKDPFVVLAALTRLGCGRPEYKLKEVK
jgi:uncharacterized Fe-S center protein